MLPTRRCGKVFTRNSARKLFMVVTRQYFQHFLFYTHSFFLSTLWLHSTRLNYTRFIL